MMSQSHEPCPKCNSSKVQSDIVLPNFIFDPTNNWAYENNGKGHYFSSLETVGGAGAKGRNKDIAKRKKSDFAYARSLTELKNKAASLGQSVTRDGF